MSSEDEETGSPPPEGPDPHEDADEALFGFDPHEERTFFPGADESLSGLLGVPDFDAPPPPQSGGAASAASMPPSHPPDDDREAVPLGLHADDAEMVEIEMVPAPSDVPERVPERLSAAASTAAALAAANPAKLALGTPTKRRVGSTKRVPEGEAWDEATELNAEVSLEFESTATNLGFDLNTHETPPSMLLKLQAAKLDMGVRFGPYWLLGSVGTGGMAEVHLALEERSPGTPRACVVKRLLDAETEDGREMFAEEGRLCSMLAHTNIVKLFDYGEIDNVPFLCFELVDGISAAHLEQFAEGGLPESVVVDIALQLAKALEHANSLTNEAGVPLAVVHRDVSPQNVLISRAGVVKLADFGIARFEGRNLETRTGTIKGKMRYLAPEQIKAGAVDGRTDVFSLGVVLAELLIGEVLFPGSVYVVKDAPQLVRQKLSAVGASSELLELIMRMTALDPQARPGSASSVRRKLDMIRAAGSHKPSLVAFLTEQVFSRFEGIDSQAMRPKPAAQPKGDPKDSWVVARVGTDAYPSSVDMMEFVQRGGEGASGNLGAAAPMRDQSRTGPQPNLGSVPVEVEGVSAPPLGSVPVELEASVPPLRSVPVELGASGPPAAAGQMAPDPSPQLGLASVPITVDSLPAGANRDLEEPLDAIEQTDLRQMHAERVLLGAVGLIALVTLLLVLVYWLT